ncbi:MAG: outer membrane protein assembly factor BamA [candidate division Zixibacteria bacterium]|nr:outer membrane protein assembly factor BamA [candidate division Zixibacteria bacterium]
MTRRARIALVLGLFLLIGGGVRSQGAFRVVDIEVIGNRVATTSLITGVAAFDKGAILNSQMVQQTIRRLYGLGMFSDVRIDHEPVTGGVRVVIVVKEVPKLSALDFSGNKKISSKELKDKLGLGVGGFISPYLVHDKQELIRKEYAGKGYFRATVTSDLNYNADSTEAALSYRINEREKVKVDSVLVTGNLRVPAKQVVSPMRNRKRGFLKSSDFAQDKYEEDLEKVAEEYHKKGYIDAYVVSDSNTIDSIRNRMNIYLTVYEGPRYYFGEVSFKGDSIMKDSLLRSQIKFKKGTVFNSAVYDESIYNLYTAYQDIGHLHVRIDDTKATRSDSILDISYNISEGLPSKINLVNIVGNTKTKDRVIRREMASRPGQVFNRSLLMRSYRDIMALNYFAKIEPMPIDLPNGDVDLEIKVEEKPTGQLNAGAGYNSQDKLVGNVGVGIPNLGGNGQALSFNVDFGSRRNSLSLSFTEPWLAGRPTLLGVDVFGVNRRYFNDYTEERLGGSVRLGRRLKWPDNYFRASINTRIEKSRFHDFDTSFVSRNSYRQIHVWHDVDTSKTPDSLITRGHTDILDPLPGSLLDLGDKWRTSSSLGLTITRDSRNLPEFASRGSYLAYTLEQMGGFLGGYWNSTKHVINGTKFIPLVGKLSLSAEVQYGVITSSKDDQHISPSDRFLVGGTNYDGMVRGYDDGSLSPDTTVNAQDTVYIYNDTSISQPPVSSVDTVRSASSAPATVRGKFMFTSNFELKYPLVERQIYAVMFFDAGNSWLRRKEVFNKLYRGWGFGFRIAVPGIGTLGLDMAKPLDDRERQSRGWHTHFRAGTVFK